MLFFDHIQLFRANDINERGQILALDFVGNEQRTFLLAPITHVPDTSFAIMLFCFTLSVSLIPDIAPAGHRQLLVKFESVAFAIAFVGVNDPLLALSCHGTAIAQIKTGALNLQATMSQYFIGRCA